MSRAEQRLEAVLKKTARDPHLAGIVVRLDRPADGLTWTGHVGNLSATSPFFIASTTKLYTTAVILRMADRRELSLDDRLTDRVDPGLVAGIHRYRGADHTADIRIHHLLAQTSGLADYFEGKGKGGRALVDEIKSGRDRAWRLEEALAWSRAMGARFAPGAGRKALYSDTNYQLLGRVIEEVGGRPYADALEHEVLAPLGLRDTYLYSDPADDRPSPLRVGEREIQVPQAMASFGPDGGIVATASDLMTFLRAFFEGRLFDRNVESLQVFRRIFFPLEYGIGISRFRMPRILSPFGPAPELVGHSGLSGAFAFLSPRHGVYLAGTVNNIEKPGRSFRLMLRLLQAQRG